MTQKAVLAWSGFWHLLEEKVMDRFDISLPEVDECVFNVQDYWADCKDGTRPEQDEKIEEALDDLEFALEHRGRDSLMNESDED